jgi:hypothetical protein
VCALTPERPAAPMDGTQDHPLQRRRQRPAEGQSGLLRGVTLSKDRQRFSCPDCGAWVDIAFTALGPLLQFDADATGELLIAHALRNPDAHPRLTIPLDEPETGDGHS